MLRWRAVALPMILAVAASLAGCASGSGWGCNATPDKLAALRRGMSYQEAAGVMGCAGSPMPASDEVQSVEWTGPGTIGTATQLDFVNDHLLYYTTRSKYGF